MPTSRFPRCHTAPHSCLLRGIVALLCLSFFLLGNVPGEQQRSLRQGVPVGAKDAPALIAIGAFTMEKNEYAEALPFFNAAEQFVKDDPDLYYQRGYAHMKLLEPELAIADFERSLAIAPEDFCRCVRMNMGFACYFSHQYARASSLFQEYLDHSPDANISPFLRLWVVLAGGFQGHDTRALAKTLLQDMPREIWPGALVPIFWGEISPEEYYAGISREKMRKEDWCEAVYFLGQLHLLQDEVEQARHMFELAVETSILNFNEYTGAQYELRRLGR